MQMLLLLCRTTLCCGININMLMSCIAYKHCFFLEVIGIRQKRYGTLWFLLSPYAAAFLMSQIAYAHDRMRYPAETFVIILASWGGVNCWRALRKVPAQREALVS